MGDYSEYWQLRLCGSVPVVVAVAVAFGRYRLRLHVQGQRPIPDVGPG